MVEPSDKSGTSRINHLRDLHQICSAFEQEYGSPQARSIESLIGGHVGWQRDLLLAWLIRSDAEMRPHASTTELMDEFRHRFPNDLSTVTQALATDEIWERWEGNAVRSLVPTENRDSPGDDRLQSSNVNESANVVRTTPHSSTIPTAIGPYEVIEEIARGGMGVVYRARHQTLRRIVALKVLLPGQFASQLEVQRFRQEAQVIAALDDPAIVPIYEVGEIGGFHYFSMPLLEGGCLADRLVNGPLPPRVAAQIVATAALAVQAAHDHGIIHRDLKPRNILFDQAGQAKVVDFGLAKVIASPQEYEGINHTYSDTTQTGLVIGTPAYMSPEQARGDSKSVTVQSDVYALGAILYAAVTGRPPFQAASPYETVRQVLDDTVVAPRQLNGQVPVDLETIILKSLSKSPADRYTAATELVDDLQRFIHDQPIRASRAGPVERVWRWCRRNPRWSLTIATTAAILVAISIGTTLLSAWALREEARGRARLLAARIAESLATCRSQRPGQRFYSFELLSEATKLARDLDVPPEQWQAVRNATITALAQPDLYPARQWVGFPAGSAYVDFDTALCTYVRTDQRGNCSVRAVDGDVEIASIPGPTDEPATALPTLSNDGRFLILRYRSQGVSERLPWATLWRLDRSPPEKVFERDDVISVTFKPGVPTALFVDSVGNISRYHTETGVALGDVIHANALKRDVFVAAHPTKPLLAVGSYFSRVVLIRDERNGATLARIEMPEGTSHAAWHPRGESLAISGAESAIHIVDGETYVTRAVISAPGGGMRLTFTHAGDHLASIEWGGVVRLWDVGAERLVMTAPHLSSCELVRFSTDDQRLACFIDGEQLGIFHCAQGDECRVLTGPEATKPPDRGITLSPDGRLLAAATADGVILWDVMSRARGSFLPLEEPMALLFERRVAAQSDKEDMEQSLLVSVPTGTYRWPIRYPTSNGNEFRVGPAEPIDLPPTRSLSTNADGSVLVAGVRRVSAIEPWSGVWILRANSTPKVKHLFAGTDIWTATLSPDGRWLLTGEYEWSSGRLWDLTTTTVVHSFDHPVIEPSFNPSGSRCLVGNNPSHLYETSTWTSDRQFEWRGWFTPSGQLLAFPSPDDSVRLIDAASGHEVGLFSSSNTEAPHQVVISPDGQYMVVLNYQTGIRLWDLARIREELESRGLEAASLPKISPLPHVTRQSGAPQFIFDTERFAELNATVFMANLDKAINMAPRLAIRWRARGLHRFQHRDDARAIEDLEQALAIAKETEADRVVARLSSELAWCYSNSEPSLRDTHRASVLAQEAVAAAPGEWEFVLTKGVANYRDGQMAQALNVLNLSLREGSGEIAAKSRYFLAMCHHHRAEHELARSLLDQAQEWHRIHAGELNRDAPRDWHDMQVEAELLIYGKTAD